MLQGTLDEFPLIDVLGILKARNKTGRLDIERQAGRGLIYVRLGEPYYAESSLTRGLIGQKLVDIGAITDMQLRKALDRQAESGDRLGQILLTHGVISRDHIAAAVISQIKDALSDLLAWETGEFRWEVGAEVEVEVPVFGGMLSENGSIPMTPHVVPVTSPVPDEAPVAVAVRSQEASQPEFVRSGTALNGSVATAPQINESPAFEPQVQPQLEVVHSPAVGGGSTDEESPPVPFVRTAAEPELHTAVENETEQHKASETADEHPDSEEPGEFDASASESTNEDASAENSSLMADSDEDDSAVAEEVSDEDESHEDASDRAVEVSDEDDSHEEDEAAVAEAESHEDHSDEDHSDEDDSTVAEDESYEAVSAEDHAEEDDADVAEAESPEDISDEGHSDRGSGDQVHEDQPLVAHHEVVEFPHSEIVESYDGTRVIKSRPAPEFDEEFDHMIMATQELAAERAAQDLELVPVDETPSFEAEPAEPAPLDEAPYFEADPVVEASIFETESTETALVDKAASFESEVTESAPLDEAPSFEAEPVDEAPSFEAEPVDEAPSFEAEPVDEAPSFEPVEHAAASFGFERVPNSETFEALAAIASEVVAPMPPPPPSMTAAPEAPKAPEAPVDQAPVDESTDTGDEDAIRKPAEDIKLDRSSLVRELSDLLR